MNILVVDDERTSRDAICCLIDDSEGSNHCHQTCEAVDSGQRALELLKVKSFDAVLLDLCLGTEDGLDILRSILELCPQVPVIILTAHGSVKLAVRAMQLGAFDFVEKPLRREALQAIYLQLESLRDENRLTEKSEVRSRKSNAVPANPFGFESPSMKGLFKTVLRAAATRASILISGESGTGKSILAHYIHQHSQRAAHPIVTVSCPSLSKELLESELFGHVRGSFSGAIKDRWGKVKAAEGGTIFLDEIGDLPLDIQPKLLRLLQEHEYERLGENIAHRADVRLIAATNRDLKQSVALQTFREDLYYRLNVIPVEVPPLRSRGDDIVALAKYFADQFTARSGRGCIQFKEEVLDLFRQYTWPGNLREMRNVVERCVILCKNDVITASDLPAELHRANFDSLEVAQLVGSHVTLEKLEMVQIRKVLESTPNLAVAAEMLGIDQTTLYRKRKKYGMKLGFRSPSIREGVTDSATQSSADFGVSPVLE